MDFVIPLPESHRGTTALLLFKCTFSGFVMFKAMKDTSAMEVSMASMECVFQRLGACEILRHVKGPRFVGNVLTDFNIMMRQRQKTTLSYCLHTNGQQSRSVKTVSAALKVNLCNPKQQDWDNIAKTLMFALNTSYNFTRQVTPFFIFYGWDAKTTIGAMIPSVPKEDWADSPAASRREAIRERLHCWQASWLRVQRDHEGLLPTKQPSHP